MQQNPLSKVSLFDHLVGAADERSGIVSPSALAVFRLRTNSSLVAFDPDMQEALANAAQRYGLTVNLPSVAILQDNQINIDTGESIPADRLLKVAAVSDSELPLVGDLRWSDAALGWSQSGGSR